MTHDPLCPVTEPHPAWTECMWCNLIAKVREDERTLDEAEQAVAKIWESHPNSDWDEFMKEIQMAFDAIRKCWSHEEAR